jgi:hypothetical protein
MVSLGFGQKLSLKNMAKPNIIKELSRKISDWKLAESIWDRMDDCREIIELVELKLISAHDVKRFIESDPGLDSFRRSLLIQDIRVIASREYDEENKLSEITKEFELL